ncbi:class I SAM-dependent methyltransferase [Rhodohalobacter sp. 614A]|uniref:class I SAM-dependent methyltransferase n=1 Tax=Rhodohalobacter sp. 614A TaxID=2908649 RepID=UPI001F3A1856|nr:methyltransferase domain-containing protein [Rhodohalobacter sp. 614A]
MKTLRLLPRIGTTYCLLPMLLGLILTACVTAQENSEDIEWLIDALELTEGSVVADVGAGDGDQTLAIAEHIGPNGQIYSTELGEESLQELRENIEWAGVGNVTIVEGLPDQANLPAECCQAIYMRRVYHHIGNPSSFNVSLLESLKPGGRLAIIDFEPSNEEAEPGGRASGGQHGVTTETVINEITSAGFTLVSSENASGRNFYLLFQKPE